LFSSAVLVLAETYDEKMKFQRAAMLAALAGSQALAHITDTPVAVSFPGPYQIFHGFAEN
jgi:hypothetical protein